jgi:hypothetical protein
MDIHKQMPLNTKLLQNYKTENNMGKSTYQVKSLIYLNWINDGIIFINDIIDHVKESYQKTSS